MSGSPVFRLLWERSPCESVFKRKNSLRNQKEIKMKNVFKLSAVVAAMSIATAAHAEPRCVFFDAHTRPICSEDVPSGWSIDQNGNRTQFFTTRTYQIPSAAEIQEESDRANGYRNCYGC
jgi:hypothetical protein